jgi:hypothetical protein
MNDRGSWLLIAAIAGAAVAIVTRRGDIRAAAWALIVYLGLAHVYGAVYGWLGPVSVMSSDFPMLSSWSFVCIFAAAFFFESFRLIQVYASANAKARGRLATLLAGLCLVLLAVIVVGLLAHPYGDRRYRAVQLATGFAAFGGALLAIELMRTYWNRQIAFRPLVVLSIIPILALVHLSFGVRQNVPTANNTSVRDYLREHASIAMGKPFRGYTATIWIDKDGRFSTGPDDVGLMDSRRYVYSRGYFRTHYGQTFTETDLWQYDIPTFEEYACLSSPIQTWGHTVPHALSRRSRRTQSSSESKKTRIVSIRWRSLRMISHRQPPRHAVW